jgi:hypothetical protein
MFKITPSSTCACNAKKFDEAKLSKKTKTEKKPKAIKQVSDKKKEAIKNGKSEGPFFKQIFKKKVKCKENFCIICRQELIAGTEDVEGNVTPACFPHILPKGTYPELRLLEGNLQFLVCGIEHHDKFDQIINELKADIGLEALKKMIIDGKKIDLSKYLDYEI